MVDFPPYIYTVVQWGLNGLTSDSGLMVDGKEGRDIKIAVSWLNNIEKVPY